jgi:hypothetical protein
MNKAPHDLLIQNVDSSKTYNEAIEAFRKEDATDMIEGSDTPQSILELGFSYGYWAAVGELTGFGTEFDR